MIKLNYHHLRLFWEVAKAGTITAACKNLNLAQPTVSAQLQVFEQTLGCTLFRRGRSLKLTPMGENILRRADEIFELGNDLIVSLKEYKNAPNSVITRFYVGMTNTFPKLLAYELLAPAYAQGAPNEKERIHIIAHTATHKSLMTSLAAGEVDLFLTDTPVESASHIRAYNHNIGSSTISIMCSRRLEAKYKPGFPHSLNGAPMVMHSVGTPIRRGFEQWAAAHNIQPVCMGEVDDTSLIRAAAQWGERCFAMPTIEKESLLKNFNNIVCLGEVKNITIPYYAISTERNLTTGPAAALLTYAREFFKDYKKKSVN